jgi:hypothetical protein
LAVFVCPAALVLAGAKGSPSACNFNRMAGWTRPVESIGTSQPVGVERS